MSDIHKALRNKMILTWYRGLALIGSPGTITRSYLVVQYAKALQCPVAEIVADMQGEDDLDFLWANWQKEIEQHPLNKD